MSTIRFGNTSIQTASVISLIENKATTGQPPSITVIYNPPAPQKLVVKYQSDVDMCAALDFYTAVLNTPDYQNRYIELEHLKGTRCFKVSDVDSVEIVYDVTLPDNSKVTALHVELKNKDFTNLHYHSTKECRAAKDFLFSQMTGQPPIAGQATHCN